MTVAPSTDRRQPGLDGLRALAVSLVIAYHGGVPGLSRAGFFGVDVFFVLSGYLITGLLLSERKVTGTIRFARFWARRARRLLPGLLLMLVAVGIYVTHFAPAGAYPGFRDDALSVLGYVSNWRLIASSSNYFAATGVPSLLTHTWSLAIEEQFYVVWPLVVWAVASAARRAGHRVAPAVAGLSAAGALASAAWMAYLYRSGAGFSRLYYGTDTHAQGLLVGAAMAGILADKADALDGPAMPVWAAGAAAGLVACAVGLGYSDPLTYEGGFLAVSLASAVLVLVVVRRPASAPARVASLRPVAYVGRISYGMYLWYFPLFAVMDHARTGLSGPLLFAARVATDVGLAALSFHLVEQPIRNWLSGGRVRRPTAVSLGAGAAALGCAAALVLVDVPAAYTLTVPSASLVEAGTQGPAPGAERIMVIGDSTGTTLGLDLSWPTIERRYGYTVEVDATIGCGVVTSRALIDHGSVIHPPAPCNSAAPPAQQWPAVFARELASDHPQVVLLVAGRWEVHTVQATPGGAWVNITQPADAAYVRSQLELVVSEAATAHALVGLATAPCYSSGESPSGATWPEDSPARVAAYNSIVRQVAAAHPSETRVVDLYSMVCPGGRFTTEEDGVPVRISDGVHYPFFSPSAPDSPDPDTVAECQAFGAWIAPRIMASLR